MKDFAAYKKLSICAAIFASLCCAACAQQTQNAQIEPSSNSTTSAVASSAVASDASLEMVSKSARCESYVNGLIYQNSAEVAGLQKQAYELAEYKLKEKLANFTNTGKKPALISDIDCTLISDAAFIAQAIDKQENWDNGPWDGYYDALQTTACSPLPGALEFMKKAADQGLEIFYITNRDNDQHDLTVAQLKHWGFPYADDDHVLVMNKEGDSNKTERRNKVLETHEVLMYFGDNIGDFTADFKPQMGAVERTKMALDEQYAQKWGDSWIVLPNSTYGDYVSAAWNKQKNISAADKIKMIKELVKHYDYQNPQYENWYK